MTSEPQNELLRGKAKFLTIGNSTLATRGALIGMAGAPIQVRDHDDAGVHTQAGAFLHSDLSIAGFTVIEGADMDEAVKLTAQHRAQ